MTSQPAHPASYRDHAGFIFTSGGFLYRHVNPVFKDQFDHFINSGCYQHLAGKGWLVTHTEINENLSGASEWYKTLKPQSLPFISYPYEWSFDMLRDAAILTLQIARECLAFDVVLRDATAYNIQWHKGNLVFIDSLSFERYDGHSPWIAYRQFCEQFLGPLLLMHYRQVPLQPILLGWPDGIPLSIVQRLLPVRSRFSLHTYLHIHLHQKIAKKESGASPAKTNFSKQKLANLFRSLEQLVRSLRLKPAASTWSHYYTEAGQRADYLPQKKEIITDWLEGLGGLNSALDAGANEGMFSVMLEEKKLQVIATDLDPYVINRLYQKTRQENAGSILPLIIDLANPSPAIGLNNQERDSFLSRGKTDLVLALALVHHLAIGRNIPLEKIASLFAGLCQYLIIEFVPKEDEKVQAMLQIKEDIYTDYTEEHFTRAFSHHFIAEKTARLFSSGRTLYLFQKKR